VQTYSIARTTAAEALRVLIDDGMAEVSPGMGTYVKARNWPLFRLCSARRCEQVANDGETTGT
jgi:DNA-binding FadR family transcriptional regulator